jgi:hypothetical protein
MARNDWVTFQEFSLDLANGVHNLGSDTFKVALIDNTTVPTAADATPRWADYSANEVSGTGYTAGGYTLTGVSTSEAAGVTTFDDTGNVLWSQNAAGPTDIYWAVLYNDSASADQAIGFLDMGGAVSLVDGDVSITWNASGILTVTVSA